MSAHRSHQHGALLGAGRASIGDLCDLLGLTARAIRYYEERGLIEARRDRHNVRYYDREARDQLATIARLRKAGLGLREVRDVLSARTEGRDREFELISTMLEQRLQRLDQERQRVAMELDAARQAAGVATAAA